MKRILKLCIITLLLVVATACQKEEEAKQEQMPTNEDYYLVYTKNNYLEHIYYGRSEDNFERIYEESSTNDLCGTAYLATTQFYSCRYILPIGNGFHIDTEDVDEHYLDLNKDELVTEDLKGQIYFNYETNKFEELKLSFSGSPDVDKVQSYNRDLSQYVFEDRVMDQEIYHYNKLTNKLTQMPANHFYYQVDQEFSKFIGYNREANTMSIVDINANVPSTISNVYHFSYLGKGFVSYYQPENKHQLNIYNFDKNETSTIENESIDFSQLQPYTNLAMIDAEHYAFVYQNQFYVYNIETREMIVTVDGITSFYNRKDLDYTVLLGEAELIFYQVGQDQLSVEIDSNDQIRFSTPIMTEHFIFNPDIQLLVNKATGTSEVLNYGKANIAYLLGPNRLYVNFTGGTSIIISPDGIEELTWIKDFLNK